MVIPNLELTREEVMSVIGDLELAKRRLTAQGLEFMTLAKKAGIPIDEKVRGRAVSALKAVLRSDTPSGIRA